LNVCFKEIKNHLEHIKYNSRVKSNFDTGINYLFNPLYQGALILEKKEISIGVVGLVGGFLEFNVCLYQL